MRLTEPRAVKQRWRMPILKGEATEVFEKLLDLIKTSLIAGEPVIELVSWRDKYFSQYDKVIPDLELTMRNEGPHLTVAYLKQRNRAAQGQ